MDKYPGDNSQRAGVMVLGDGVVFKEGDLEAIPFPGEPKFDFLYASHVLEHAVSIERAVLEINRVSGRGYIEAPSPLREQIFCPWPYDEKADFHKQYLWADNRRKNTIHFIQKSGKTAGEFCSCPNGQLAHRIFDLYRKSGKDIEPLLPKASKTTVLYFNGAVQAVGHESFEEACREGHCGYASARHVRQRTALLLYLFSKRSRQLRALLGG